MAFLTRLDYRYLRTISVPLAILGRLPLLFLGHQQIPAVQHQLPPVVAVFADLGAGEALVHLAGAMPGDDLDAGLRGDPLGEVLVGKEDHAVDAEAFHDLDGIGGGAADR